MEVQVKRTTDPCMNAANRRNVRRDDSMFASILCESGDSHIPIECFCLRQPVVWKLIFTAESRHFASFEERAT